MKGWHFNNQEILQPFLSKPYGRIQPWSGRRMSTNVISQSAEVAATVEARVSSHIYVPQALLHTKITATSAQPLTSCLFYSLLYMEYNHPFLIWDLLLDHTPPKNKTNLLGIVKKPCKNKAHHPHYTKTLTTNLKRHNRIFHPATTPFKYCRLVVQELGLLPQDFWAGRSSWLFEKISNSAVCLNNFSWNGVFEFWDVLIRVFLRSNVNSWGFARG